MSEESLNQFNGECMDAQKHVRKLADPIDTSDNPKLEHPRAERAEDEHASGDDTAEHSPEDEAQTTIATPGKGARWSDITSEEESEAVKAQQIKDERTAQRAEARVAEQKEREAERESQSSS